MLVHISSGNGVDEVARAVWLFYKWLQKENYKFELIHIEYAPCQQGVKSLRLQSQDKRFNALEGTLLWRSLSPFRPKHKRKNWYFSLECYDEENLVNIDTTKITYQSMKSPKKGGQHVNTTNSGVRAIYAPLSLEAIAYDERSQHRNKQIALVRLLEKVEKLHQSQATNATQKRWVQGKNIQRGQAVKTFVGKKFESLT